MTTKLTLTVDESVIKKAKLYAKSTGRSLSELIENYLNTLTNDVINENSLSPTVKKLAGIVKLHRDFDEKKELRSYYDRKPLMRRVFVDTNVIVDFLAERKPFSKQAIELFDLAEKIK